MFPKKYEDLFFALHSYFHQKEANYRYFQKKDTLDMFDILAI